jgi:predicted metal-binding protein
MEKCRQYGHVFLFTSVAEVSDNLDFAGCLAQRRDHEKISREIGKKFQESFGDILMLTTGCTLCDACTYPNEPCRHPEERVSTIESHGILIMQTAAEQGISYDCGNNMVTYFTLIFFNVK